MTIASIMSHDVITIGMYDSLRKIRELFEKFKFHHLLVVENGRLFGVISDRDLLKALSPYVGTISEQERDLATLNKKAHLIMSRRPITVTKDTSIETAANLLLEKKVSCLPVLSSQGDVEGLVTWKDILKFYVETKYAQPFSSHLSAT